MIKHTLSFYIADKIENAVLQAIARKAFEDGKADFWVAAVGYMDNFFKEKEDTIIFVRNKERFEVKNETLTATIENHFVDSNKKAAIGLNKGRNIDDIMLVKNKL